MGPTPRDVGESIRGQVLAEGAGLAAVQITFTQDGSQQAVQVGETNDDGYFANSLGDFDTPPAGQITFSKGGYESLSYPHVPTRSTLSMRFGCWETIPEQVELSPQE